ncbi:MAG: ADP-ribosylglycohydrolase family protein [Acidimicrobiaceae bacterium]|nr:ADP-ribosylglycohydrolase family protein [Acidimicrobiaceae bacterium]
MGEVATRDRFRGCLLGLAAGDALGTTLEFKPPGSFEPMDDMVGGGPFGLQPGQWTDDTSMALCLATSLLECNGFDPTDTTGAIYGQIAGAYYGAEAIPASWRDKLAMADEIISLADRLHDHAASSAG